jgi:thioredoxin 1
MATIELDQALFEETIVKAGIAGISSIPTLMAFRCCILLFNQAGALPEPNFEELIQAVFKVDMESVKKDIAETAAKEL